MLDEWNAIYVKNNGERVKLTWNELYILEYMIEHKNRPTTRKELTEATYGKNSYYQKNHGVGNYIARLRKKLVGELKITNRAGIGYQIKYIGE